MTGEFRTDEVLVRGVAETSLYPVTGDVFTVRYLRHHPQDFMIRNDDQSPWARKLACARLDAWKADAQRQSSVAPNDANFARQLTAATAAKQAVDCP